MAEGFRAALSTAAIVALNEYLQWPVLNEAALAALLTCLCDAGGPMKRRLPSLLTFGFVGALITAVMGLARGIGPEVLLPIAGVAVFMTSFARIYGPSALQVGNLLSVVLVLGADRPVTHLALAGELAGSFIIGSLWALLLTMVIWRVRPYLPARRAVAESYHQLAVMTDDLRRLLASGDATDDAWEHHARMRRRAVRESIEQARALVLTTVRARGPMSGRAGQSMLRLETAEQIFRILIGLSELLELDENRAECETCLRILRRLGPLLIVLARLTVSDATDRDGRLDRAISSMSADGATLPADGALAHMIDALVERLRVAATLSTPLGYTPGTPLPEEEPRSVWDRVLDPIRSNLTWQSAPLRHALRVAVTAVPALAFTTIWYGEYEHWLTITMIVTMQPYFALTFTRALERIGGTVAGGLLASVIAVFLRTPLEITIALFPLAIAALSLRAVNFALFMTFLTPLVVLLSELGRPDTSQWFIAGMRALYIMMGGMIALAGSMLLWPAWEPMRLGAEVRTAMRAHAKYAFAELSYALGEISEDDVEAARRAAGVATNNVEASVQRALLEPGTTPREQLEAAMLVDAALRRMAGRLTAMQMDDELRAALGDSLCRRWRDWISESLERLASGNGKIGQRPPLGAAGESRHTEALARIARQIELMAGAIDRAIA